VRFEGILEPYYVEYLIPKICRLEVEFESIDDCLYENCRISCEN